MAAPHHTFARLLAMVRGFRLLQMEWVVRALLPSTTFAGLPSQHGDGVIRALQMEGMSARATCLLSSKAISICHVLK